jgi:selenocysteine lyase/cysteine desulfurase
MGMRGLGLFYVREELHGEVLKPMMYGDKQYANFEFHYFPGSPPGETPISYQSREGAEMYEIGNVSNIAGAAQREALKYILKLGVDNILAHAKPMCDKLIAELPKLGYPCITPPGSPTPITGFLVENPKETNAKLKAANVVAKIKWKQLRVSPTVFNTLADVDQLLDALS